MRILTYPSPFEIKKNKELWNIVSKYPHFCASDTLLQGLEVEYGRESFGIFRTVDSLIKKVMKDFIDDPQNDIQMFLDVSNFIREIKAENIKNAFKFNKGYVVDSVKLLMFLECDKNEFEEKYLTEEQKELLIIYEKAMNSKSAEPFKRLQNLNHEEFIKRARCVLNDEIKYMLNDDEFAEIKGIHHPLFITTIKDGYDVIKEIVEHLKKKSIEPPRGFQVNSYPDKLKRAEHILSLITNEDNSIFDKVIIHGVHRITPEMYFLFKMMEKIGVEVVFLINFAQNLPNTYRTWREVYSWCDVKFEFLSNLDMSSGNKIGVAIANIIEGRKIEGKLNDKVIKYSNLTSFTDREVRNTFKTAGEKLNRMRTQYYAVRGESSNEILKVYFPEQFGQKPFLSYPIGQFIMNIYQMWDFEKQILKMNDTSLYECAVSNIYGKDRGINLPYVINKIKLYFSNVETIDEYYARIEKLKTSVSIVSSNKKYEDLKRLSFFNVSLEEISEFKGFLDSINDIATKLFCKTNNEIDFGEHFKTLVDLISSHSLKGKALTETEKLFIDEISAKLSSCEKGKVKGNIEDAKDALAFYLSAKIKEDTSNWIVRDFEQIDGSVLLRKLPHSAKVYHFALLSNSQMLKQPDDVLSWPLSIEMFNGYLDIQSAVPIINKGLLEMRNFLKFMLFYGTFFSRCKVKLSYIEEENDEQQVMYYLLKVLGLDQETFKEDISTDFNTGIREQEYNQYFSSKKLNLEAKRLFSICPYKFLQKEVLKSDIEYSSEYQIKYFASIFLYFLIRENFDLGKDETEKIIKLEFEKLKKFFPFWDETVFADIFSNGKAQIDSDIKKIRSGQKLDKNQEDYKWKKYNFLIAQWTDTETNEKCMNYNKPEIDSQITSYMRSSQLYPKHEEIPYEKVCEDCNFIEICLRHYYEAYASQVESEE